ncbi:MAG TPA: FMN-binding protein [Candidatus Binatia bacterium]|jgi:Na+-translocating ferredoxin:NAD+ oxidoreductase RnfG subunit|nr:FMN-binding protein [Candidatus Binatia bacterium]
MNVLGKWFYLVCLISSLGTPLLASAQEGIFLKEEEAPKAVFPDAASFSRNIIRSNAELKDKIKQRMGKTPTSLWEDSYITFVAKKGEAILGYAVIVEEIGKHRPITFIVGVGADGKVKDVALMVYREAYGGEVRDRRFLSQYEGKDLKAPLLPYRDIRNITGATLSVEAIGRGTKKALALVGIVYLPGEGKS